MKLVKIKLFAHELTRNVPAYCDLQLQLSSLYINIIIYIYIYINSMVGKTTVQCNIFVITL